MEVAQQNHEGALGERIHAVNNRRTLDYATRFRKEKLVGAGTYGKVYRALDISEDPPRQVALKEIRLDAEDQGVPSTALREISLLRELDHPNVIKCAFWSPPVKMLQHHRELCTEKNIRSLCCRLHDIVHTGAKRMSEAQRLTLVFEYAEQDLKDYMTSHRHMLLREPFLTKVSSNCRSI